MKAKWVDISGSSGRSLATDLRAKAEPPTPKGIELDIWPLYSTTADQSSNDHSPTVFGSGIDRISDGDIFVADFGGSDSVRYDITKPASWTIITAVKTASISTNMHLCGAGANSGNQDTWGILYQRVAAGNGTCSAIWGDGTNHSIIDSDTAVFSASEYRCFGVRFTTGTADVDMISSFDTVNTTVTTGNATTSDPTQADFYVGQRGGYTLQRWQGKIARFWLWSRALSDREFDHRVSQIAQAYCGV